MRAHAILNLFLALVHLCAGAAGPMTTPKIFGVITDLHGLKIGDMGADPLRKLGTDHVPILNPMALWESKGHARNLINGRKGARHNKQGLA